MLKPTKDWDDAYANGAHIPGSEVLPERWAQSAADYRASGVRIDIDVAYGDHPREKFDLIWPDATPKGLVVFVHGGYWMRFDKSYWSDLAEGARAHGWAVCLPSYTLAPEARIHQITAQIGAAITLAATQVEGPLHIAGHSAGGHLVSRMVCDNSPLAPTIRDRIAHTMSISGLHDLRPLLSTQLNSTLHIDEAEALQESAALRRPAVSSALTCWVGGDERPEFIRQSQVLPQMWEGLDANAACVVVPGHNHFTVVEDLKDPNSALVRRLLAMT